LLQVCAVLHFSPFCFFASQLILHTFPAHLLSTYHPYRPVVVQAHVLCSPLLPGCVIGHGYLCVSPRGQVSHHHRSFRASSNPVPSLSLPSLSSFPLFSLTGGPFTDFLFPHYFSHPQEASSPTIPFFFPTFPLDPAFPLRVEHHSPTPWPYIFDRSGRVTVSSPGVFL